MPTQSRAFILIGLVAMLIGIVLFFKQQSPLAGSNNSLSHGSGTANNARSETETHGSAARTKSRSRPPQEEPEFGETLDTLRVVIPGLTEFPEQTLQQRILATNALLKKHHIALRFGVDEELHPSNHLLDLKVPAFSKKDARPIDILRQDVKALDRHYFISGRMVLYQDGSGG